MNSLNKFTVYRQIYLIFYLNLVLMGFKGFH